MDKIDLIFDIVKSINQKQDEQSDKLSAIEVDVETMKIDLSYHIRRTDLLEEIVSKQDAKNEIRFQENVIDFKSARDRLEKLELPGKSFGLLLKLIAATSAIAGLIFVIQRIL